jgi:branched-chain amino acid aminotransferase
MPVEKSEVIWFDGQLVPWDQAQVHVLTHTLHYGLGVFEGIRCYEGRGGQAAIFRLHEHLDRLFGSAHILGLTIPFSRDQICAACIETVHANKLRACYIRPLVFLGAGEMGLHAVHNPVRVAIVVWSWGAYLGEKGVREGVRLKTASFQRFHVNTFMTKAKAVGNYINSILASNEAHRAGYDEAMLLDTDGFVAECSGENIFVVRGGRVKTTPPATVLAGITRDAVLSILQAEGVEAVEERFTRDEAYLADEVFMTGTAAEVTPVREIDDRQIGPGHPGPITQNLQRRFWAITRGEDVQFQRWLTPVVW